LDSDDEGTVDDMDYVGDIEDEDSDIDSSSIDSSSSYESAEDSTYDPNQYYDSRDPIVFTDSV
jgi:hypothetical protein